MRHNLPRIAIQWTGITSTSRRDRKKPAVRRWSKIQGQSLEPRCVLSAVTTTSQEQLQFATYLGGSAEDSVRDVAIDASGFVYATGGTASANFRTTPGAYQRVFNANALASTSPIHDAWVAKFAPDGRLIWSTFLGGPSYDRAYAIEVDATGVYIAGRAGAGFPTTTGALQRTFAGDSFVNPLYGAQDGFVSKLSLDGSRLLWSTYFGESGRGFVRDIDTDAQGNVYVAEGEVHANSPHVTAAAFQRQLPAGRSAVIAKISANGAKLIWGTYLGGSQIDLPTPSVRVSSNGQVIVAGTSDSSDYPTSPNARQRILAGGTDLVVTALTSDGARVVFSCFLGGRGTEETETHNLEVDASGNIFVAATSFSSDFPTTAGTVQTRWSGAADGVVAKFSASGTLLASTYLGGTQAEELEGIGVDALGRVTVTGSTLSRSIPAAGSLAPSPGFEDLIVRFANNLTRIDYASVAGGSRDDQARTIAIGTQGMAIGGETASSDFIVTNGSVLAGGGGDGIVMLIASNPVPSGPPAPRADDLLGHFGNSLWAAYSTGKGFVRRNVGNWSSTVRWSDFGSGDFNGDGLSDVAARAPDGTWWVGLTTKQAIINQSWGAWSPAVNWQDVLVADVNGDGRSDILGRTSGQWWVARSTGTTFVHELWGEWAPEVTWQDVAVGDINGDHRSDLVGRIQGNGTWWAAIASGTQSINVELGAWSPSVKWVDVQLADVNADGRDDLIGRADGMWWVGRSIGLAIVNELWGSWSNAVRWQDVRVGDFNGDGRADLAGRADGDWWIARSTTNGFVNEKWGAWSTALNWQLVIVADFSGDGRDDIVGRANGQWWVSRSMTTGFVQEFWGAWPESWLDIQAGEFITP